MVRDGAVLVLRHHRLSHVLLGVQQQDIELRCEHADERHGRRQGDRHAHGRKIECDVRGRREIDWHKCEPDDARPSGERDKTARQESEMKVRLSVGVHEKGAARRNGKGSAFGCDVCSRHEQAKSIAAAIREASLKKANHCRLKAGFSSRHAARDRQLGLL